MAMLERLSPPRPPSPIIGSPKENAEKDIVPSASEDEGVATSASTSEENDEIHDAIPRTTLVFSTPVTQSDCYASSYSKDRVEGERCVQGYAMWRMRGLRLYLRLQSRLHRALT